MKRRAPDEGFDDVQPSRPKVPSILSVTPPSTPIAASPIGDCCMPGEWPVEMEVDSVPGEKHVGPIQQEKQLGPFKAKTSFTTIVRVPVGAISRLFTMPWRWVRKYLRPQRIRVDPVLGGKYANKVRLIDVGHDELKPSRWARSSPCLPRRRSGYSPNGTSPPSQVRRNFHKTPYYSSLLKSRSPPPPQDIYSQVLAIWRTPEYYPSAPSSACTSPAAETFNNPPAANAAVATDAAVPVVTAVAPNVAVAEDAAVDAGIASNHAQFGSLLRGTTNEPAAATAGEAQAIVAEAAQTPSQEPASSPNLSDLESPILASTPNVGRYEQGDVESPEAEALASPTPAPRSTSDDRSRKTRHVRPGSNVQRHVYNHLQAVKGYLNRVTTGSVKKSAHSKKHVHEGDGPVPKMAASLQQKLLNVARTTKNQFLSQPSNPDANGSDEDKADNSATFPPPNATNSPHERAADTPKRPLEPINKHLLIEDKHRALHTQRDFTPLAGAPLKTTFPLSSARKIELWQDSQEGKAKLAWHDKVTQYHRNKLEQTLSRTRFEYENDLSTLSDAPTPTPRKEVTFAKDVRVKIYNAKSKVSQDKSDELADDIAAQIEAKLRLTRPQPIIKIAPLIASLTNEESTRLASAAAATDHGRKTTSIVAKPSVSAHDFSTLLPKLFNGDARAWLNDNIVDTYLELLVAGKNSSKGWKWVRGGVPPPTHAFRSAWFTTMTGPNKASIKRWTRKPNLEDKKFLDARLLLLPVCVSSHWRLVAIKPQERTIEYFDSLGGRGDKILATALDFVAIQLGKLYVPEEWTIIKDAQRSSMQKNASDCGIFTVLNALCFLREEQCERVISIDGMDEARKRVAISLLAGKATTELTV